VRRHAEYLEVTTHTVIESLGIYLPPRVVSSHQVMQDCRQGGGLQLERLTGIRNRRMAGDGIYSIDLAIRAVAKCLENSRHGPSDIGLVICCNMSRLDGPDFEVTVEPGTATRLARHFGLSRALTFDVNNACAGMFTAIRVADAMIKAGQARVALIASGEYITHLTRTAQLEIDAMPDPRMACLTLGDCGAALILEATAREGAGFHAIDLYTAGAYSDLSIAKPTDQPHGGAIMFTDSRALHEVAIAQSAIQVARTLGHMAWGKQDLPHVVIHQTSERFFYEAAYQINVRMGEACCDEDNMLNNLAERGNTATTTHMLAVWDAIESGRLRTGDNMLFAVQASGLTIGAAAYTFDDLPDRIRANAAGTWAGKGAASKTGNGLPAPLPVHATPVRGPRIRLESIGLAGGTGGPDGTGMELLDEAIGRCLSDSSWRREDVALLIYAGVHRDEFLAEPAIAALAARRAGLNPQGPQDGKQTFAFDLYNGAIGFLQACHVACGFIQSGTYRMALVAASEIENNRNSPGAPLTGVAEAGSAAILSASPDAAAGFGLFVFRSFPEHIDAWTSRLVQDQGRTSIAFTRDAAFEDICLACITATLPELLEREGLRPQDIRAVLPPQLSSDFVARLRERWPVAGTAFVDIAAAGNDPYSSTLVHTLHHAQERGLVRQGDIALIINVGAGLQVGCATYYF
jgi:3-oxoacyl-[acyl-carrier-protein] synthase III